jgi:hypothetical protein
MHKAKFWAGIGLILIALLPTIGLTFGLIPVFAGTLLVAIAVLGGYLLVGGGVSHGWKFWTALILIVLAIGPTLGFVLLPALVFSGPLLVAVAVLGGYFLASKHHR